MSNRFRLLLGLLLLTLGLLPQAAAAKTPTPQVQTYAYNCSIGYGDLAPDRVTCNGVTFPLFGPKQFYTTTVPAGRTIYISGQVTPVSSFVPNNTGYLWIESVTGYSISQRFTIRKSGTVSWTNDTKVAQNIKLTWRSNGPFSSYRVQGQVWVK